MSTPLTKEEAFLVFDKYYNCSVETQTKKKRAGHLAYFFLDTPLPPIESTLLSSINKVRLINLFLYQPN